MSPDKVIISRQQLYDLVWTTPITDLSQTYLISASGLRKACLSLGIPLPKSGHWSKVKAGKAVIRKPMTEPHTGEQAVSLPLRPIQGPALNIDASPQARLEFELEQDTSFNFRVPKQLLHPDPLIIAAHKALTSKKASSQDGLLLAGLGVLDISVSPPLLDRALRVMDTVIKVLKKRGYSVKVADRQTYLVIGGEDVPMTLRETRRQEDIKDRSWNRMVYHPSGLLKLKIERYSGGVTIADTKQQGIEDQLIKLVARIDLMGERLQQERIERARWRAEHEEKQRLEQAIKERKRTELSNFKKALTDANCWNVAQEFRAYIDQVEAKAISEDSLNEELQSWLIWARKKADWLDPLVRSADPLLTDVDPYTVVPASPSHSGANNQSPYSISRDRNWPTLPWL